jgi:hypothetical protein
MNKLEEYFYKKPKRFGVHKWLHYFEIYDRHLSKYVAKQPSILEIGVNDGGSLEMWDDYFGDGCKIYGLDVKKKSKEIEKYLPNVKVSLGDQGSVDFWDQYKKCTPEFDIIIDDGGHEMDQQITTFECMYDHIKDDGVYLCEDTHTSYRQQRWKGGVKKEGTYMEYTKSFVDYINAWHWEQRPEVPLGSPQSNPSEYTEERKKALEFKKKTHSVHFYDSVVVLEKRVDLDRPTHERHRYPRRKLA